MGKKYKIKANREARKNVWGGKKGNFGEYFFIIKMKPFKLSKETKKE